ncbi:MAG: hypothetical protein C3F02_04815 [Parcubacteria group bacterium]|nr:MAG: hypothetical protein C3F02_04815 [Parcubacteria group bacterium]
MKIGIISNLYPPFVRGGAEIVAAVQAGALKQSWQHVFVISTRPKYLRPWTMSLMLPDILDVTTDEVDEVIVYRFRPLNVYYYLDDFKYPGWLRLLWHLVDTFNIFSYRTIKKILLSERPDVVITHNLMGLGFLLPRLLRKLKIRHIHVLHDLQLITPSGLIIKNKEKSWEHGFFTVVGYVRAMKSIWGSPDAVISPSKYLLSAYTKEGFFPYSKKIVLPNPIKSLVQVKRVEKSTLDLLYLGQVSRAKGAPDLIRVFHELSQSDLRLHVVGLGQDMNLAKKIAGGDQRIIFHGWLQHSDLQPLIGQVDVLIVPSLCYENSPTVIYEALSMGLPVLVADIGGAAELIQEDYNGWIFPAGDFTALKSKIINLYNRREKLAELSDNCRQSVADYLVENYSKKLLDVINEHGQTK